VNEKAGSRSRRGLARVGGGWPRLRHTSWLVVLSAKACIARTHVEFLRRRALPPEACPKMGVGAGMAAGCEGGWEEGGGPLLSWGLTTRGIGLVYAISFASLGSQILAMAGSRGISPSLAVLRQLRTDFPNPWLRFWYFPSLLHLLPPTDAVLRGVCAIGCACGLAIAYGGLLGRLAAPLAWGLLLSLDLVADLNYPWDCLLLEVGVLTALLPGALPLLGSISPPALSLGASAMPSASLHWAFRWLLFRVLFGFGKLKFVGTGPKDSCYVRSFLIGMPIPSPAAWYARAAPLLLHQLALVGMFVIEIPLPFLVFAEGWPRLLAGLGIGSLQLGIALTGNFGHFNVLTLVMCLPLLEGLECGLGFSSSGWYAAAAAVGEPSWAAWAWALDCLLYAGLGFLGAANLPFNSWCARSWPWWPALVDPPGRLLAALIAVGRATATWRLCHAYGVFPPHSSPPARFVAVIEGSDDGARRRPL
jgi:hypothetical protein